MSCGRTNSISWEILNNDTSDLKIELLTDDDLVEEEQKCVVTNASSSIYPIEAVICAAEC